MEIAVLTRKQHDLLLFIHKRIKDSGVSPSFDEMKDALQLASKSGVQLLARGAARELGHKLIRSNVIQPGPIDTDMNPADGDKADFQRMMVPLGRYGTAEEIALLTAFLASDDSAYVNAAVINADGGMNS